MKHFPTIVHFRTQIYITIFPNCHTSPYAIRHTTRRVTFIEEVQNSNELETIANWKIHFYFQSNKCLFKESRTFSPYKISMSVVEPNMKVGFICVCVQKNQHIFFNNLHVLSYP